MNHVNTPAPPGCIWTSRGWLYEATLTKTIGAVDDDNEHTTWQEWRHADGELVKREAQIQLKRWPVGMDPAVIQALAGSVGG